MKNGQEARLPSLKTSRISALLRRRCDARVERCAMTDPIRPSACAVLWPGDAPESVGHPLSSSAHESHGCVCAPYSTAAASSRTSETSVSKIPVRSRAAIIGTGVRAVKHGKYYFGVFSTTPLVRARSSTLILSILNFASAVCMRVITSSNPKGSASLGRNRIGLMRATTKLFR